jgi:hypothetical protein
LHRLYGHDLDIVGATYCQRRPRHAMTHRNLDHSSVMPPNNPLDPLHEVESLGSGCILIKASVFAALEQPYYTSDWLDKKQPQGEDRGFCLKARAAGFKVWCDIPLSYEMGHCGTKIFRASDVDYVLTGEES